ncbi:MAG: MFS transporter [Sphingobium sp.]|nr:MFS transporter [Sphingobium sp.]
MKPLGWIGIARLGLVQFAIGAVVMLSSSLLNRLMVVEYGLPAAVPAGLVAWHYAVQLSRPVWGHGSDRGHRRTPWIIGGMVMLAGGAMLAVASLGELARGSVIGFAMAILAFTIIGAGVGAAGTSLLALLATRTAPERRAAAAAITWIMMIVGIVITAGVAGRLIDPFTPARLMLVAGGIAGGAVLVSMIGVWGVEGRALAAASATDAPPAQSFVEAVREMLAEPEARHFTGFVFLAMLAYSMQDLVLEPFAGLVFGMTPGQSTQLSGTQHSGVLVGMILVGVGASAFGGGSPRVLRRWIVGGCVGSALALVGLGLAARAGPGWPLTANIWVLGFANGVFAVAAIGAMMSLAGAAGPQREGVRMGVWGAAQAIAFGLGGLTGAVGVDIARAVAKADAPAFTIVFACEGALFLAAAWLAVGVGRGAIARQRRALA